MEDKEEEEYELTYEWYRDCKRHQRRESCIHRAPERYRHSGKYEPVINEYTVHTSN